MTGSKPRAPAPVGRRYGRLVVAEVLGRVPRSGKRGSTEWSYRLRCDCGASKISGAAVLRDGSVSSCGCLRREVGAHQVRVNFVSKRGRLRGLGSLPANHGDTWDD